MKNKLLFNVIIVLALASSSCLKNPPLVQGEGTVEISGGKIWYYVIGEGDKTPLLMMHGGPGGSSYSLFLLGDLGDDRPIILFDQVGTGRSEILSDTSLMTMDYMLDQTKEFVDVLGLEEFYIYGHSWGCMLGLDYYLTYPKGIRGLVLNSPLVSTKMWIQDADTLISTLADSIQQIIRHHEEIGVYDTREYQWANYIYYKNFITRKKSLTNEYNISRAPGNNIMYEYMWGPSEFNATGTLIDYNRIDDLDDVRVPTLFVTGEYDEARPTTVKYFSTLTPRGEFAMIEDAGHGTMHDNQAQNIEVIDDFLERIDR
jgi:proline iminopeptidase